MEELKEDYSGLSREEVLELAKKWEFFSQTKFL